MRNGAIGRLPSRTVILLNGIQITLSDEPRPAGADPSVVQTLNDGLRARCRCGRRLSKATRTMEHFLGLYNARPQFVLRQCSNSNHKLAKRQNPRRQRSLPSRRAIRILPRCPCAICIAMDPVLKCPQWRRLHISLDIPIESMPFLRILRFLLGH